MPPRTPSPTRAQAKPRTTRDVIDTRLRNQRLARTEWRTPADVVSWMGAMQGQEYAPAKWGIGRRGLGLTDAIVGRALDAGEILRTHLLRATWHIVAAADIRWLLALTGPRVHAANAFMYRKTELDAKTLARGCTIFERALRGGKHLTRNELGDALRKAGIEATGFRLGYLVMYAELEAVIANGARRGKQSTYALFDERVPATPPLTREEALLALTQRYFASHGPATVKDFAWWSSLTMRDIRAGIALATPSLVQEEIDGLTHWSVPSVEPASSAAPASGARAASSPAVHLLPVYDEYFIAYKDRGSVRDPRPPTSTAPFDGFANLLAIDGRLRGTWRRTIGPAGVTIDVTALRPLTRAESRALAAEADRHGAFLELPATLTIV